MSLPLSNDLRLRVVNAVLEGASQASVATRFAVSPTAVSRWCRIHSETGTVDPSPLPGDDWTRRLRKVRRWLKKRPDIASSEAWRRFEEQGDVISLSTVWRLLNEAKSPHPTKKRKPRKPKSTATKGFYLTAHQMKIISRFLPKSRGKPRVSDLRVLSGIIHVLMNGMSWRAALPEYGPYKTLYNRWKRWCDKGIFMNILLALVSEKLKTDVLMLDSTHIKAHRTACSLVLNSEADGREIGKTAGGRNCKLHVVTDANGRPVLLYLTAGNKSDIGGARVLIDALPSGVEKLVADRAYDANWFRDALEKKGIKPCIPPRRNRTEEIDYDPDLYKSRNEVERCIGRLKDWRRVATRYDRCSNVFLNACALAAIIKFWL